LTHAPSGLVEAEEQRADAGAVLVDAVAGDRAVRRPLVLHLDHRPLVGRVGAVEALGDDAVEAPTLEAVEPALGHRGVLRGRREVERRHGVRQEVEEDSAALAQGLLGHDAITHGQHVEQHDRRRRLLGQAPHP